MLFFLREFPRHQGFTRRSFDSLCLQHTFLHFYKDVQAELSISSVAFEEIHQNTHFYHVNRQENLSQLNILLNHNNRTMKGEIYVIASLLIITVLGAPVDHEVTSLKDYYNFQDEFKMYSGYLNIQEKPLINMHYLFVTSKHQPASDDIVLWLNGGPGCSSLLGFLQELGPHLLFQGSQKLSPSKNPYSWNNNANVLFLQSPPGVGFSINEDPNYQYNDTRTASDGLIALRQWFKLFPEYSQNKFWISGQSYCGMYIPLLADQVLKNLDTIVNGGKLNFQGILIGNGVMLTELHWRRQARNTFFDRHYFYGPEIKALIANCKYNSSDDGNFLCQMGNKLADQATQRINPYNAIGICYQSQNGLGGKRRRYWYSAFDQEMYNQVTDQPGCSSDDQGITLYFNQKEVQDQLHVKSMQWSSCSDHIGSNFKKDLTTIPLFESFKKAGLKILLYSGNVDAQVSYIETEEYIRRIGWPVMKPKKSVLNPKGSLEGWVTVYDGLVFYVINAAGHMVPSDKPNAALRMFESFRAGQL